MLGLRLQCWFMLGFGVKVMVGARVRILVKVRVRIQGERKC